MVRLVEDCLLLIFAELQDDLASLYSCILVNRTWCRIAVPILWNYLSHDDNAFDHKEVSRIKLYNVIAHFLPNGPKDILPKNHIILPSNPFPNRPILRYMNFFTHITPSWIEDMILLSIDEEVQDSENKKILLEKEIYKLIISKCGNVRNFCWCTDLPIYRYPNARIFFSNLRSLEFSLTCMTTETLFELAQICRNITDLEVNDCDEDNLGLARFIEMQNNLQSLYLNFDEVEEQCVLLSNAIEEKAATLKKITIKPIVTSISPKFLPSLTKLEHLTLNNDDGELEESTYWNEWRYYLSMAVFKDLRYLETSYLPCSVEHLIIEKSGGNISEIKIYNSLEYQDSPPINKKLIKAVSNHGRKITRLTMDVNYENVHEISRIFLKCLQLKKVYFIINTSMSPNGDELLRIINSSPTTLQEFSFGDKWNFSVEGLQTFFENWKSREIPLKFTHYYDELMSSWTADHISLVKKYVNEKVIK